MDAEPSRLIIRWVAGRLVSLCRNVDAGLYLSPDSKDDEDTNKLPGGEDVGQKLGILLWCVIVSTSAWALPNQFVQEGLLLDSQGQVLNGNHRIVIKLYGTVDGDDQLFLEIHPQVPVINGYYAVYVGSEQPLPEGLFERAEVFLGITIDNGRELAPRTAIAAVPAALTALTAQNVTGNITPTSVTVGGQPVIDAAGKWVGDPTGLTGPQR